MGCESTLTESIADSFYSAECISAETVHMFWKYIFFVEWPDIEPSRIGFYCVPKDAKVGCN